MKLTIYDGHKTPMIAIGKNQCNLLEFAYKYPGWHTFHKSAKNAIKRLQEKGYLEVVDDQFRLNRIEV